MILFSGEFPLGTGAPMIGFTVEIYDGSLHTSATAHKLASFSFQFNRDCVLERYSANDLNVPQDKSDALMSAVNSHPEWNDDQIARFLKEKGAKFGPSDRQAFLNSLKLSPLELLLEHLKIKDVHFVTASQDHVGEFAELQWVMDTMATKKGYLTNYYKLRFDPMDGELVSILRIPGPY